MLRRIVIAALLAGVFVPSAGAAGTSLAPGITYTRQLLFTPRGPEVVHVMTIPKPGGLYALHPVLSNNSVQGRETVTSMQKRLSSTATVGGVNADLYTWNDGTPNGMFMDSGQMTTAPFPRRSTVGVTNDGRLLVDRLAMLATWQGSSQRRPMTGLNQPAGPEGVSLFTPAWGPATPVANDTIEVVLNSFPTVAPLTDLTGTVVAAKPAGGTPIPPGGAVLVGRGASAGRLATEAPVGQQVTVRLVLRPQWNDVVDAVGGGPLIVQNGRPIFRALEQFTGTQLSLRRARTAVGQRADGKIVLVAVDGALPGYSTGMTNFELAQQLVRLGAVTASALDSGTSTTMAFDGKLLNQPSDPGGERGVADGLFVFYYGVQAPAPTTDVVSPNGDGVDEAQQLSYKVVRPSTVTASLIGPDGAARQTQTVQRAPGTYTLDWAGRTAQGAPEPEGRWRWVVDALDDRGQQSHAERVFYLNNTLGYLRVSPSRVVVRRSGGGLRVAFRLAHPAAVTLRISTVSGATVQTVRRRLRAGTTSIRWNGRYGSGIRAFSGPYVASVRAVNAFGPTLLERRFRVLRAR
jgi:phosphodiester glycosidase/flagellar hook capping protein FlgD